MRPVPRYYNSRWFRGGEEHFSGHVSSQDKLHKNDAAIEMMQAHLVFSMTEVTIYCVGGHEKNFFPVWDIKAIELGRCARA